MLIVSIAINAYSQYYIGITYRILLNAMQYMYIQSVIGIMTTILNVGISVFLMNAGYSIAWVKFVGAFVFLMQPIAIMLVVKSKTSINTQEKYDKEPIEQKWNGLAQHVAFVIFENTDIIVLTLFSTYKNISIYAVYNLVTNGIRLAINSLTEGVKSLLGKLYAEGKQRELQNFFGYYEWIMHVSVTVIFSLCAVLISPNLTPSFLVFINLNIIYFTLPELSKIAISSSSNLVVLGPPLPSIVPPVSLSIA